MANLKDDLDQYLLLNSDQKKNIKIDFSSASKKLPRLSNLFGKKEQNSEVNNWLEDSKSRCCPELSRFQRILGFVICLSLGVLFMTMSSFFIPVLILKARKFVLLYTLGSIFFILSFCFLTGFAVFLKSMFTKEKFLISMAYFSSLSATIYFAMFAQSTAFTVLFAVVQIISLLLMILNAVPGGMSGIKLFGSLFKSGVSQTLPV